MNGLIPQEWEVHVLPRVPAAKAGVRGSGLRPVENHPSCVSRNVADKGASPNLQGLLCTEALERLPGGRAVISSWCGCPLTQFPHHASLLSARRLGCHVSGPLILSAGARRAGFPLWLHRSTLRVEKGTSFPCGRVVSWQDALKGTSSIKHLCHSVIPCESEINSLEKRNGPAHHHESPESSTVCCL